MPGQSLSARAAPAGHERLHAKHGMPEVSWSTEREASPEAQPQPRVAASGAGASTGARWEETSPDAFFFFSPLLFARSLNIILNHL